jgi:hypothetical protein
VLALLVLLALDRTAVSAQQHDANALEACSSFLKGIHRISDGVVNVYGIGIEMRSVYGRAEQSGDAGLRQRAAALVREAEALPRAQSTVSFMATVREFASYCSGSVIPGFKDGVLIMGPKAEPEPSRAVTPAQPTGGGLAEAARRASEELRGLTESMRELRGVASGQPRSSSDARPQVPGLPPARVITAEEVDRHLQQLFQREGVSDVKCIKKQYGSGWVTVCE